MPGIDEYKKIIGQHCFSEIIIWEENADRYFKNQDEMIKWIDQPSIVPFLKLVENADKENFRSEVLHRMIDKTKQPDETCFETFRRINVFAKK